LSEKYSNDVQFYFVYCREAHAIDSDRPTKNTVEQPVSTEERRKVAQAFLDDMDFDVPALLDNIDDKTSRDYASHPDRLYLVGKDGKVSWAGDKGPFGFKPELLAKAIESELSGEGKSSSTEGAADAGGRGGPPNGGRGGRGSRGQGGRMMSMPVMKALDGDQDGKISAGEIEKAVERLKQLDTNKDGKLSPQELMRGN
jgi:hypothetical protein